MCLSHRKHKYKTLFKHTHAHTQSCVAENHDKLKTTPPDSNSNFSAKPEPNSIRSLNHIRNVPHCGINDNYIWQSRRLPTRRGDIYSYYPYWSLWTRLICNSRTLINCNKLQRKEKKSIKLKNCSRHVHYNRVFLAICTMENDAVPFCSALFFGKFIAYVASLTWYARFSTVSLVPL